MEKIQNVVDQKTSNENVLAMCNVKRSLVKSIRTRQLQFLGHLWENNKSSKERNKCCHSKETETIWFRRPRTEQNGTFIGTSRKQLAAQNSTPSNSKQRCLLQVVNKVIEQTTKTHNHGMKTGETSTRDNIQKNFVGFITRSRMTWNRRRLITSSLLRWRDFKMNHTVLKHWKLLS